MAVTAQVAAFKPQPNVAIEANNLQQEGRVDEATKMLEDHLTKNPDDAQALTVLASCLKKLGKGAAAYYVAKYSATLRPERPETWCAVGHTSQHLWRTDEALSAYRKAIQKATTDNQRALYQNNIGSVYLDIGQFKKAGEYLRKAVNLNDKDPLAKHNLGLSLLAQHQWREGWEMYSASVGTPSRVIQKYGDPHEPTWDGTKGKTVVVYGEQGLGDEICAASMLPDVIRDSARVVVDCDHRLKGLFKRSFPAASVYGTRWTKDGEPKRWHNPPKVIDYSVSAFEVAKFYRNADEDFPGTPYLVPDPDRVAMWKGLFATKRKPVIGIAWSGGTWANAAQFRQLPLAEWAPIFEAVDAHWVSLQYKDAARDIEGTPVVQYPYGTLTKDYDDTAALVASCDLVIAMQTSVVHLAGALGVPVWTMIPSTSQWRYGEEGTSLPWYKSATMYRQGKDWTSTVQDIAKDLHDRYA